MVHVLMAHAKTKVNTMHPPASFLQLKRDDYFRGEVFRKPLVTKVCKSWGRRRDIRARYSEEDLPPPKSCSWVDHGQNSCWRTTAEDNCGSRPSPRPRRAKTPATDQTREQPKTPASDWDTPSPSSLADKLRW